MSNKTGPGKKKYQGFNFKVGTIPHNDKFEPFQGFDFDELQSQQKGDSFNFGDPTHKDIKPSALFCNMPFRNTEVKLEDFFGPGKTFEWGKTENNTFEYNPPKNESTEKQNSGNKSFSTDSFSNKSFSTDSFENDPFLRNDENEIAELKKKVSVMDSYITQLQTTIYNLRQRVGVNEYKIIRECIKEGKCTFWATESRRVMQNFYKCETCFPNEPTLGACESCINKCHKGHKVSYVGFIRAFCDCGERAWSKYGHNSGGGKRTDAGTMCKCYWSCQKGIINMYR